MSEKRTRNFRVVDDIENVDTEMAQDDLEDPHFSDDPDGWSKVMALQVGETSHHADDDGEVNFHVTRLEDTIALTAEEIIAKLEAAKALLLEIEDASLPMFNMVNYGPALDEVMDNCPRLIDIAIAKLK